MIRGAIFQPEVETARKLRQGLSASGLVEVVGFYYDYPHFAQLERLMRMHRPNVIFAGTDSLDGCAGLAANARLLNPGVSVVATGSAPEPDDLMCLFDSGIREFLGLPFDRAVVRSCLDRLTLQSENGDTRRHHRHVHGALAGA